MHYDSAKMDESEQKRKMPRMKTHQPYTASISPKEVRLANNLGFNDVQVRGIVKYRCNEHGWAGDVTGRGWNDFFAELLLKCARIGEQTTAPSSDVIDELIGSKGDEGAALTSLRTRFARVAAPPNCNELVLESLRHADFNHPTFAPIPVEVLGTWSNKKIVREFCAKMIGMIPFPSVPHQGTTAFLEERIKNLKDSMHVHVHRNFRVILSADAAHVDLKSLEREALEQVGGSAKVQFVGGRCGNLPFLLITPKGNTCKYFDISRADAPKPVIGGCEVEEAPMLKITRKDIPQVIGRFMACRTFNELALASAIALKVCNPLTRGG